MDKLLHSNSSNQPLLYLFPSFPSSEAGCKSRKIFYPHKTIQAYICIKALSRSVTDKRITVFI
jgi:hypothetical protein